MLTQEDLELAARGCYLPSSDERVRAMGKVIEHFVFPECVGGYTYQQMIEALNQASREHHAHLDDEKPFTPFLNCGWKHPVDGCCSHPKNATPECHQGCCPIKSSRGICPECDSEILDTGFCMMGHWCGKVKIEK